MAGVMSEPHTVLKLVSRIANYEQVLRDYLDIERTNWDLIRPDGC